MKPTSMICLPLVAAWALACCSVGNAQVVAPTISQAQQASDQKPTVTGKKRRNELIGFVKKHLPELRPLLNSLRKNRPEEFEAALRTLDVEIKRLEALEQRSPERYKTSLEQWVVKSKIKLVAAQLVTKKKEEEIAQVKKDLKALIYEQHSLRVALLAGDVAIAKKRFQRLETLLKDQRTNRNAWVQQQMNAFLKNAKRTLAAQKRAAAAKKKQAQSVKPPATEPLKKD